jgi:hypothetical protein
LNWTVQSLADQVWERLGGPWEGLEGVEGEVLVPQPHRKKRR